MHSENYSTSITSVNNPELDHSSPESRGGDQPRGNGQHATLNPHDGSASWVSYGKRLNALAGILKGSAPICVYCPDFFATHPARPSFAEDFEAIRKATNIKWLIGAEDHQSVAKQLPNDWDEGFDQVSLTFTFDENDKSDEGDMARVGQFRSVPCRYRAVMVRRSVAKNVLEAAFADTPTVILDWDHEEGEGRNEEPPAWAVKAIEACIQFNVPYYTPSKEDPGIQSQVNASNPERHPRGLLKKFYETPSGTRLLIYSQANESTSEWHEPEPGSNGLETAPEHAAKDESGHLATPGAALLNDSKKAGTVAEFAAVVVVEPRSVKSHSASKQQRFIQLDAVARDGICASVKTAHALMQIQRDELWRTKDYQSWNHYCESFVDLTRNYVNRLIRFAKVAEDLAAHDPPLDMRGDPILPVAEGQCRTLAKISNYKDRVAVWRGAVAQAGGMPTAKVVSDVACTLAPGELKPKATTSKATQLDELLRKLKATATTESSWEEMRSLLHELQGRLKTLSKRGQK